jgi:hypothetical protein
MSNRQRKSIVEMLSGGGFLQSNIREYPASPATSNAKRCCCLSGNRFIGALSLNYTPLVY